MSTLLLLARFLLCATLLLLARFLLSATLLAALLTTLLLLAGLLVRILILIHLTSSPTLVRSATQSRARLVAENNVQRVVLFQVQLELDVHRTCSLRIRGGPTDADLAIRRPALINDNSRRAQSARLETAVSSLRSA